MGLLPSSGSIRYDGREAISRQKETLATAVEAGKAAYREAVGEKKAAPSADLANEGV